MKYIKKYELVRSIPKYEHEDIIKVKFKGWSTSGPSKQVEFMTLLIIKSVYVSKTNIVSYSCYPFESKDKEDSIYVNEHDVIEKITQEEANIIISADKYNL